MEEEEEEEEDEEEVEEAAVIAFAFSFFKGDVAVFFFLFLLLRGRGDPIRLYALLLSLTRPSLPVASVAAVLLTNSGGDTEDTRGAEERFLLPVVSSTT